MDLTNLSQQDLNTLSKELAAESLRRKQALIEGERKVRAEKNTKLFQEVPAGMTFKDVLLSFVEHGRTSCSDENPSNAHVNEAGYPRCNRCALLKFGSWDAESTEVTVDVGVRSMP